MMRRVAVVLPLARSHPWPAASLAVMAVALAVYVGLIAASFGTFVVVGDEFEYLAVAQSLLTDHDVDLQNQGAGQPYPPGIDYLGDGRFRSLHGVGLPILILPGYAAAGRLGASAVVAVLGALLATLTFRVCRTLVASEWAAAFATLATAGTLPIVVFATQVWTEVPSALLIVFVVWLLVDERNLLEHPVGALAGGFALGMLPWLHAKHAIAAAILGGFALVWLWRRGGKLPGLVLLAVAGLLYGLLLLFFSRWYGNAWPDAAYRAVPGTWQTLEGVPTGLLGLLLDRSVGLLSYAPVDVLAVPGLLLLARRTRPFALLVFGVFATSLGVSAAHTGWWAGGPGPARFLVPVVPLLAPPLAALWSWPSTRWSPVVRGSAVVLLAISLAIGGLALADRILVVHNDDGRARLYERIWGPASDATNPLPALATASVRQSPSFNAEVGRLVPDRFVYRNQARLAEPGRDPAGFLAATEGIVLRPGRYRAFFRLKVDRRLPEAVARIELVRHRAGTSAPIDARTLAGVDFAAPDTWQHFALEADVSAGDALEPRVDYTASGVRLWFDSTFIARRLRLPEAVDLSRLTFGRRG